MTDRRRNLDEAMRFGWSRIQLRHYHALKVEVERLDAKVTRLRVRLDQADAATRGR